MKNIILRSAIALIVLFSISTAFTVRSAKFDNAKWNKGPCVSNNVITGVATGLGTGPYELRVTGFYDCVNNGSKTPNASNWSALDVIIPVAPKQQGGNFKLTATIPSQCDHANWTFITRDLQVTLTQNGVVVIPATNVASTCN
jgi:hypothetical protein